MSKLPGKLLCSVLVFFVLTLTLLVKPSPLFAEASVQDIFNPSVQDMVFEKKQAKEKASKGELQIYSTEVNNRQLNDTAFNLADKMIGVSCAVDKDLCNGPPPATGVISNFIALIYANPPASGIYYAYDLFRNAGFVQPAYAQGIGFAGLSPLLPLWKTTRNIAYMLIVIIMIAIGFMVIFRMKIDPKTVISVQAAIPKIILAIIIITLSYPIVGFLIDMMYVVMALLIKIIGSGMGYADTVVADKQSYYMTASIWNLLGTLLSGGFSSVDDFIRSNAGAIGGGVGIGAAIGWIVSMAANPISWPVLWGVLAVPALLLLILALGILFTWVRLLMLLLNSYIQLIIAMILGPLILLQEAIPGRSAFSEWIMNILANLVVYPATVVVLMFADYLVHLNQKTPIFQPPLVGVPGEGAFFAFLGLGVLFLAPTLVASIKKAFHPKPVLPLSAGTLAAPLTSTGQTVMGAASQFYYMKQIYDQVKGGGHGK